ncbi:MAG: GBS Bsp-like repeat-containing protein [Burkholderiales bacterium]|nr:GBS Bsp-like repeat-containing protein [Burkholderiales bacterium]
MIFAFNRSLPRFAGVSLLALSALFTSAHSAAADCYVVPSEKTISLQTSGTFRVYAYGVAGASSMSFPTWAEANGQDDLVWYAGVNDGGGVWHADINLANHKANSPQYGNFLTHAYIKDAQGVQTMCGGTTWQRKQITGPATCSSLKLNVANRNEVAAANGYLRIYAKGVKNAVGLSFPTWSQVNGQDDLVWYQGVYDRTESDGTETWHVDVNLENHKAGNPQYGTFSTHAYVQDVKGSAAICTGIDYNVTPPTCNANSPEAQIYIIAGQSNALGLGKISEMPTSNYPVDYAFSMNFPDRSLMGAFDNAQQASRWAYGANAIVAANYSGDRSNLFGPEVSIARTLRARGISNFFIFKAAVGGSTLAPVVDPWPYRGLKSWLAKGEHGIYDSFISEISMASEEICRSGRRPVVKALYWMQGEGDAMIGQGSQYYANLKKFIDQVNAEKVLGTGFPIVIGKIKNLNHINSAVGDQSELVRKAQQNLNGYLGRVRVFDTQDLSVIPNDQVHYDAAGQVELGNRFVNN